MRRSFFIKEITKCIILFLFMIIFCGGEDISFASTDQNSLPVEELSDAITASSGLPLWGCKAIVGGSSDGSMVIYRDICRDEVLGITRHIESSVPEVERLCYEDWYDEKNKVHYAYDDSEKRYVFFPNEDSEDVEEYLSLEYWLDTESIEGDATYSYGEDTLFETVDGKTVPCKTINATVTRTVMPFIIINAFSDEDFSEKTYNIYTTYLIGIEDGRLYSMDKRAMRVEGDEEIYGNHFNHSFYYPTENLEIPASYKNSSLATGSEISYKGVIYTARYKSGKTVLQATDYISKTKGKIVIPATVSIQGKKYKVTSIAKNSFKKMTGLKQITIGKNVTSVGKNAFSGCKKLKKIIVKNKKLKKKLKKNKWYKKRIAVYLYP